jgi:putative transposase
MQIIINSCVYLHAIFSVKFKDALIATEWRDHLYKELWEWIIENDCDPFAIGGTGDHLHLYFDQHPNRATDDLLRDLQKKAAFWINEHRLTDVPFEWQDGYACFGNDFSCHRSLIGYIGKQEAVHETLPFLDEYRNYLLQESIEFEEEGLPHLPI